MRTVKHIAGSRVVLLALAALWAGANARGVIHPRPARAQASEELRGQTPAAGEAAGAPSWVILPGNEVLIGDMLGVGATLPEGCTLTDGKIEYDRVKATYACPNGEVAFELVHPSVAPADATRTERIALVLQRGTPPASLTNALVSRIRARENAFEWNTAGQPRASSRGRLVAAGIVLVAIVGWLLRRRASARRTATQ